MNFETKKLPFMEGLQKLQSVIEKKNSFAILANVFMTLTDDTLTMTATNLTIGLTVKIKVSGQTDGQITIPLRNLVDLVKELPDKLIRIQSKQNHWVSLSCDKINCNIVGLAASLFPLLPTFDDKNYFRLEKKLLCEMIDRTSFCVSTDITKPQLNGCLFEAYENNTKMTATDGHRLAIASQQILQESFPEKKKGIIPSKGLQELAKLLGKTDEPTDLAIEPSFIFIQNSNHQLFIRFIDGDFPQLENVIPKNNQIKIRVHRQKLQSALRRLSLLVSEDHYSVKLSFQDKILTLYGYNTDFGEIKEDLELEQNVDSFEIAFNTKYLLEYLTLMKSEHILLSLSTPRSAVEILETNELKDHYLYVLMPMTLP